MKSRRSGTKQGASQNSNSALTAPNPNDGIEVDSVDTSEFPGVEIKNQCPVFLRIKDNNQVSSEKLNSLQTLENQCIVARHVRYRAPCWHS